jgi:hypothetical protein
MIDSDDNKPSLGDKTEKYPYGYGFCQCGCGRKTSKLNNGMLASYVSKHHPFARQRAEVKRSEANERKPVINSAPQKNETNFPSLYSLRHNFEGKSLRSLTFSRLAVEILKAENDQIKTKNFRKEIRKFLDRSLRTELANDKELAEDLETTSEDFDEDEYVEGCIRDMMLRLDFVPDAYNIDELTKTIYVYEVEDEHPLTIPKLESLANSWLYFHEAGYNFRVFIVDRYCHDKKELDLDFYEHLIVQYRRGEID